VSAARDAILAAVGENLQAARAEGPAPAAPEGPAPGKPAGLDTAAACRERFVLMLHTVGAHVYPVADLAGAAHTLERIADARGGHTVARSDAPVLQALAEKLDASIRLLSPLAPPDELFQADLGLTAAQHAIAETGTLVLVSDVERNRLASLLPPVHVALLRADAILPDLGAALAAVHDADAGPPRTITFITGPSRTADIELTLVVGVHGPQELHVILLESSCD